VAERLASIREAIDVLDGLGQTGEARHVRARVSSRNQQPRGRWPYCRSPT
jgi:hypothetical protein